MNTQQLQEARESFERIKRSILDAFERKLESACYKGWSLAFTQVGNQWVESVWFGGWPRYYADEQVVIDEADKATDRIVAWLFAETFGKKA